MHPLNSEQLNKAQGITESNREVRIDEMDRRLILETQTGLPLVSRPYALLADKLNLSETEVMQRMQRLQAASVIRRIGAVPNHYKLGYRANGMSVWNVPDDRVDLAGERIGALPFVSHCYQRPRCLPEWPYNLFAMVHAKTRDEAMRLVDQIAALLHTDNRGHAVLFSTRILKKTGLRLPD